MGIFSYRFGKERENRGEEQPFGGASHSSGGDAGSSSGAGAG